MRADTPDNNASSSYSPWYLRYVMLLAFLVVMISLMDRYVVSILMEQIKTDLSLTDTQLGWLVGPAFVVVHILSQLPLARMADRSVRRNMIAVAMALWSLFTIASGFTKNFTQLFITRMGVGITEAASAPALASLLSDYFSPKQRGLAMSMLSVGGVAGIGAGMLLGGIVGQAHGWQTALIVAGIPGVILSVVFWLTIKEPLRGLSDNNHQGIAASENSTLDVIKTLFANRSYRWLIVGASLSLVTGIGRGAWEPVFLMRVYELDQAKAGMIYFLISPLPSMLGGFLGGVLVDRLIRRNIHWFMWFPALAMLLSFPLMVCFLLWPSSDTLFDLLPIGFAFSIAGSIVGSMVGPAIMATAQSLVNANMRAMSHAVWTMAANLIGMGLGPLAAGWLSELFAPQFGSESIRYSLLVISSIAVPAALVLWLGASSLQNDLVTVQTASPQH